MAPEAAMTNVGASRAIYRFGSVFDALKALYQLSPDNLDAFLNAYQMFDRDQPGDNDEQQLIDYYRVINQLCAIGEVEKMYIPPMLEPKAGILDNQHLFEEKMARDLALKPGDKVLDVGCGRGRVAAHLADSFAADVTGINIDPDQLASAATFVAGNALADRCHFRKANFNDPLPFADGEFDALYQIQVISYAKDKEQLFREMHRVLKPGARLSFLDWVLLDKFDPDNSQHRSLLARAKPLVGAVDSPYAHEITDLLQKVGFEIVESCDVSVGGHQAPLIEQADVFYNRVRKVIALMAQFHVIPAHFVVLFDRLTKDGDAFIEADKLGILTSSYQTIAVRA
jgi:sterol 24-C-methyltransferase